MKVNGRDMKKRGYEILEYIVSFTDEHRYSPTVREIGRAVGLASSSTIHGWLERLISYGYLEKDLDRPRTFIVTERGRELIGYETEILTIPYLGVVTAGDPILAIEETDEYWELPRHFVKGSERELYMLTIRGNSMINAGILDGDQVIVRKQNTADPGDIVIALVNDEGTCKRYFPEGETVRLQPENEAMSPFIFPADEVLIVGLVRGLYREFGH